MQKDVSILPRIGERKKQLDCISLETLKIQDPSWIKGGAGKVCAYQAGKMHAAFMMKAGSL